ncbi:MAG: hypothetical protein HPY66_2966 [Firmicutes bacterium]|nr:hypothetical protein [Bacillota bacterium]
MEVLIFDICGRFAHFRKFFTNSSSLTYCVPPRTVLEGMIAAILGKERDSYYDALGPDNLNIAVKKLCRTRKIMQTLNYLKATGVGELIAQKEHTQIPFEIVTGEKGVKYRVYISHSDSVILADIRERLENNKYFYPPYMGSAPFNCNVEYIDSFTANERESHDYVYISTLVKQDYIEERGLDITAAELSIMKEKMPRDFEGDRRIKEIADYLYEENGFGLRVKLNRSYFSLNNENIVFL